MKGVVYKLDCLETGDMYIGSSISLKRRIRRGWKGQLPETFVRSPPIVIEEWEGVDERELRLREQYHIDQNPCVNRIGAFRTKEDTNRQKLAEYHRNKDGRQSNKKRRENRFTCEFCDTNIRWDYRHLHFRISNRCIEARKLKVAEITKKKDEIEALSLPKNHKNQIQIGGASI